jgi:hypothetical protein
MQTHVAVQRRVTSYVHAESGRDSDLRDIDGRYHKSRRLPFIADPPTKDPKTRHTTSLTTYSEHSSHPLILLASSPTLHRHVRTSAPIDLRQPSVR